MKRHEGSRRLWADFDRASGGGGGGGSSRSGGGWNAYQLSMLAGLLIFTTLGWRIVAQLGRIRRALDGAP